MADVMYDAKVFCRGKDVSNLFSEDFLFSIDERKLRIFLSEYDAVYPFGQDISLSSVKYFWYYEQFIRSLADDGYEEFLRRVEMDGINVDRLLSNLKFDFSVGISSIMTGVIRTIDPKVSTLRPHRYSESHGFRLDKRTPFEFELEPVFKTIDPKVADICPDRNSELHYWRLPDEKYLLEHIDFEYESESIANHICAVNALYQLLLTWRHDDVRRLHDSARRTKYLFDVLFAAKNCQKQYWDMEWSAARCIWQDIRERIIRRYASTDSDECTPSGNDNYDLSCGIELDFPLLHSFNQFQSEFGKTYERKLEHLLQRTHKNQEFTLHYWSCEQLQPELEKHFYNFCREHNDEYADWAIASKENIDRFEKAVGIYLTKVINRKLQNVKLSYDLSEACIVFETDEIYDALYALMLVALQQGTLYSTCNICHKVFPIDDAYARSYCPTCKNSPSKIRKYQRFKKCITAAMNLEKDEHK